MREVTTYIAFDDKEFDNYEACLVYENKAYGLMCNIMSKYSFYDKDMKKMELPHSPNVEDLLTWLDNAYSDCTYIKRYNALSSQEEALIDENLGCCMLNYDFKGDIGLFSYDISESKWVKVDE